MTKLAGLSLVVGSVTGMLGACMLFFPSVALRCAKRFPRHRLVGGILAAAALTWSTILLMHMQLGFLEKYKPLLMFTAPITFLLIIFFVDELLAPRALGGLLLLLPAPILTSARLYDTRWRYFAIVVAYIMVIKGIALVLHPYLFRKWCERVMNTSASARAWGAAALSTAAVWIALALTVY